MFGAGLCRRKLDSRQTKTHEVVLNQPEFDEPAVWSTFMTVMFMLGELTLLALPSPCLSIRTEPMSLNAPMPLVVVDFFCTVSHSGDNAVSFLRQCDYDNRGWYKRCNNSLVRIFLDM